VQSAQRTAVLADPVNKAAAAFGASLIRQKPASAEKIKPRIEFDVHAGKCAIPVIGAKLS